MRRAIPYTLHGAVEIIAGPVVMVAPFVLGLGAAATIAGVAIGAVLIGLATQLGGPQRSMPLAAHAGFDYVLAVAAVVIGIAIGFMAGEWRATIFLVAVGFAEAALTASTRWSAPAGA